MMPAIGLILPSLTSNTYPRIGPEGDDGSCAAACGAAQKTAPKTAIKANGVIQKRVECGFIYGCPTLGAPAVIVGVDVVVERFVAATAMATAAAPPTIRIHFNLPLLWRLLPEGSVLFVCCADVVTD